MNFITQATLYRKNNDFKIIMEEYEIQGGSYLAKKKKRYRKTGCYSKGIPGNAFTL